MSTIKDYNLFLDDFRNPEDVFLYKKDPRYNKKNWVIVRSYTEFVSEISEKYAKGIIPKLISFDHDLADEHYQDIPVWDYDKVKEKTGYHCAQWLINFCIDTDTKLPECLIHSMNPVGSENIFSLLESFKKFNFQSDLS